MIKMKSITNIELVKIFKATENTLFFNSSLTKIKLTRKLQEFKKIKRSSRSDNDYFWKMVCVTFYSGFRAATVTNKIEAIREIFNNIERVSKYDEVKVQKIIDGKKVIGHRQKINGIIHNAKQIKEIQKQHGSFDNYLTSFGDTTSDDNFFELIKDLKKKFKYLGGITVYHFLTDLGFNVIKPDRVLCRIFYRLGFVESEKDYAGVIETGRRFSNVTNLPIRYIDIVFVLYGQVGEKKEFGQVEGICLSKKPKCELCGIYTYCIYSMKKKLKRQYDKVMR